jgi:hypothetical protein
MRLSKNAGAIGQWEAKKAFFPRAAKSSALRAAVHTMLPPLLLLLLTACLAATVRASSTCSFPDGGAASGNLSCAPLGATFAPTALTVTATGGDPSRVYTDVVAFAYSDAPSQWPDAPRQHEPGRRVLIAAADIRDWQQPNCFLNGTCSSVEPAGSITIARNMKRALAIVDAAGAKGADVVQLPEEFKYSWVTNDKAECPHSVCAEPLRGPTYQLLRERAIKYSMHIVYGTRENATDGVFNTAVVLDRKGEIAATYRKVFPFSGPTNHPGLDASSNGTTIVDLDFGRAAFLTCFDANFAELWLQAMAGGAELVFWGSAYLLRSTFLLDKSQYLNRDWSPRFSKAVPEI